MYTPTGPINPWLRIWFSPRLAIQAIVNVDPRRRVIPLSVLAGIALFSLLNIIPPQSDKALLYNLGAAIVLGALAGLLWIYLGSRLLLWTSRWLGGDASLEELRVAIAWATLPRLFLLTTWLLPLSPLSRGDGGPSPLYTLFIAGLAVITLSWELLIFLKGMTAISQLSMIRSLAAGILAMTMFVAAAAAIMLVLRITLAGFGIDAATSPILMATLLVIGAVFSIVIALRSTDDEQPEVETVQRLESWKPEFTTLDDMELSRPWQDRIARPIWKRVQGLGTSITPKTRVEQLRTDLLLAGTPRNLTVTDFLGLRFLSVALISGAVLLYSTLGEGGPQTMALIGGGFIIGWNLPDFWLRKRINKRQKEIQRSLPDALDMLSICVDAGLGFEAAILRVSSKWDNALATELQRVVAEIRVGIGRAEALHHMVERTGVSDVASFVAIVVQADRLGVSIGPVLQSQSEQMRVRRRQRAQEEAQKAPVKMLMPLAAFILPATFAVSLGPAIPRIMRMFG